MKASQVVALAAGAAILVGFFLPWITVSASTPGPSPLGLPTSFSQSGIAVASGPQGTALWILPVAGVVALGMAFFSGAHRLRSVVMLICGVIAAYVLYEAWTSMQWLVSASRGDGIAGMLLRSASFGFGLGYWLCVLGVIGVVVSGFLGLFEPDESGPFDPGGYGSGQPSSVQEDTSQLL